MKLSLTPFTGRHIDLKDPFQKLWVITTIYLWSGKPEDYSQTLQFIRKYLGKIPIFGICLGHQMIGALLGLELTKCEAPHHGSKLSVTRLDDGKSFKVPTYNSLAFRLSPCNQNLLDHQQTKVLLVDRSTQEIYGMASPKDQWLCYQFHPESFLGKDCNLAAEGFLGLLGLSYFNS